MGAQTAVRRWNDAGIDEYSLAVLHPRLTVLQKETFTRPARLLLAHPDPDQRLNLSMGLRRSEWGIQQFSDAGELLEWLANDVIENGGPGSSDLIIMDARLPGRRGIRLLADLRRAGWSTPVVLLAENGIRNLTYKAKMYGNAFVFKTPFDVCDLHTAVVYLLDRAANTGWSARCFEQAPIPGPRYEGRLAVVP
jgi:DNA-binding response OmpR family regulator